MEALNSLSARSLQYFVIARKWNADIAFYNFETRFLRSLLEDNYFVLPVNDYRENVKEITDDLLRLDGDKNQLEKLLVDQLHQLELMSEDVIPEDVANIGGKQIRLEHMVSGLFSEYKNLKREIFSLVQEASIQNKKLPRFVFQN